MLPLAGGAGEGCRGTVLGPGNGARGFEVQGGDVVRVQGRQSVAQDGAQHFADVILGEARAHHVETCHRWARVEKGHESEQLFTDLGETRRDLGDVFE